MIHARRSALALVVGALLLLAGCMAAPAGAADAIPQVAARYRHDLTRNARLVWGLDAPVATLAGQIHQESGWRHDARSAYANGLAQFTPDTADWISGVFPDLASRQPDNPAWALRALVRYDRYLWERVPATAPACDRMAFALSSYNGGLGWAQRDRRKAAAAGADPDRWWSAVEKFNAGRAPAMFAENRGYPRAILYRWEPLYVQAGWGRGVCAE